MTTRTAPTETTGVDTPAEGAWQHQHVLDLDDFSREEIEVVLNLADRMREVLDRRIARVPALRGQTVINLFYEPSTRTRVSFDVGMRELGGETIMLTGAEMQLGRGETIADTARVLSRYVDAIMIRILDHDDLLELARYASVPVINGLTKRSHPCQIMADLLTFEEHRGPIKGRTIAWTGDANNVLASWIHAAQRFDFTMRVATPSELAPPQSLIDWARQNGAKLELTTDPFAAVDGAHAVVSDCWVSMGDEDEARRRQKLLSPYQVNAKLMSAAAKDAIFMHCLPAHRGEEVTDEVMDGPQSVVFDEAENRLHAQKGIMAWCLGALPA